MGVFNTTFTKINLKVKSDNSPAIKLYEKLGFRYEGKMIKDTLIVGIYYDVDCMGMEILIKLNPAGMKA